VLFSGRQSTRGQRPYGVAVVRLWAFGFRYEIGLLIPADTFRGSILGVAVLERGNKGHSQKHESIRKVVRNKSGVGGIIFPSKPRF